MIEEINGASRDGMTVVSLTTSKEFNNDTKEFRKLLFPEVDRASYVYADEGYDSRKNFQYLSNRGVRVVIPPLRGSKSLSRSGGPARGRVVRRFKKLGLEAWKKEVQ